MQYYTGAMFALKRKKMYEAEVSKLQGAKISLESQAMALENAAVNVEILKSMKAATDAMKSTRLNLCVTCSYCMIYMLCHHGII